MPEQTRSSVATSISTKLQALIDEYAAKATTDQLSTQDEFFNVLNQILWEFYETLNTPYSARLDVKYKDRVTPARMLEIARAIQYDIEDSYARVEETQQEFLRRANRYLAKKRSTSSKITRANNVISSISRTSEDRVYEIGDSFNDTTLIDLSENEQSEERLFIHEEAGLATLNVSESQVAEVARIRISDVSNGFIPDNNNHGLDKLIDDQADTWFDYQRNTSLEDDTALRLELLVSLKNVKVINLIELTPIIFTEKSFIKVQDIGTSLDGREFRSIRQDIPTNITQDEEESYFTLGPEGLKNQEAAQFIFTPRATQYIKIVLVQGKKIKQSNNNYQQKISLAEIKILSQQYSSEGILKSRSFTLPFVPRKYYLEPRTSNTNPLTILNWQISVDGGSSWIDIEPFETLEINTGAVGSVDVAAETNKVAVRVFAERDRDRFTGIARPLAQSTEQVVERVRASTTPTKFTLQNIPIEDSLRLLRPVYAIGQKYGFEIGTVASSNTNLVLDLPASIKPLSETIKVNGYAFTRKPSLDDAGPNDKWYVPDYTNGTITFGDSLYGIAPQGSITIEVDPEKITIPDTSPYIINLDYNHDFNRQNIKVRWYDKPQRSQVEQLAKGVNEFQVNNYPMIQSLDIEEDVPPGVSSFYLEHIPVSGTQILFTDKSTFATEVDAAPSALGEYQIIYLGSKQKYNPVQVKVYRTTNNKTPGKVLLEAAAKILQPQSGYSIDGWNALVASTDINNLLDVYQPSFSDTSVFNTEKTYIDGVAELNGAGDYSIDYENGKIYSFSDTDQQGFSTIQYTYQLQKDIGWSFAEKPNQLIIDDSSFLVGANDTEVIILTRDDGQRYRLVFKDDRWIDVPLAATSPITDNDVEIDFDKNDYLRGWLLPAGQTRVRLPNQALIKNSLRFVFVSNDVNAYDDRIVGTDADGNIFVNPKPIKDVYGNRLANVSEDTLTQRDVDKTVFTREKAFIDGDTELEQGGDYSIDYENGILYTATPTPGEVIVQYKYADVRVSYIATSDLVADQDYTFDIDNLLITVNNIGDRPEINNNLIVKYDIIDQLKEDPSTVFSYYSPIIMGYTLKARKQ